MEIIRNKISGKCSLEYAAWKVRIHELCACPSFCLFLNCDALLKNVELRKTCHMRGIFSLKILHVCTSVVDYCLHERRQGMSA